MVVQDQMNENVKIELHSNTRLQSTYLSADKEKFTDLIKEYKKADKKTGREAIRVPEMARLAKMNYEMFRKILNFQKPTKKETVSFLYVLY